MKGIWKKWWVGTTLGLLVGMLLGFGFSLPKATSVLRLNEEREMNSSYKFTNPLLACGEDTSKLLNDKVRELEARTKELIDKEKAGGTVTEVAVYFRQFGSGPWFGIDEDTTFTPGSLLKVPLIMSIYSVAEKDPSFLQKKIFFEGGTTGAKEYFASQEITPNTEYTVQDLVNATLIHSDNNAAVLLTQLMSREDLNNSYSRLGITTPQFGADYSMSVRTYASFFRVLYNGSYISPVYSEQLLETLSRTTFTQGVVAGVPQGVVVAHKFGERSYGEGLVQLHDCGIVYKPHHPFLLCVMMRGKNFDQLADTIRKISELTYQYSE